MDLDSQLSPNVSLLHCQLTYKVTRKPFLFHNREKHQHILLASSPFHTLACVITFVDDYIFAMIINGLITLLHIIHFPLSLKFITLSFATTLEFLHCSWKGVAISWQGWGWFGGGDILFWGTLYSSAYLFQPFSNTSQSLFAFDWSLLGLGSFQQSLWSCWVE